jgi:hypothetical protein
MMMTPLSPNTWTTWDMDDDDATIDLMIDANCTTNDDLDAMLMGTLTIPLVMQATPCLGWMQ